MLVSVAVYSGIYGRQALAMSRTKEKVADSRSESKEYLRPQTSSDYIPIQECS